MQYGDGINGPLINAINRIWGEGTTELLEKTASQTPTIKGTLLDLVDYRMSLEQYFKDLIDALDNGISPEECMKTSCPSLGEEQPEKENIL